MSAAASVIALAGLGWFGFWLLLGLLKSVVEENVFVKFQFSGLPILFFLLSVVCAAYFAVGGLR